MALLLLPASGFAYSRAELRPGVALIRAQLQKLEKQGMSCAGQSALLAQEKDLRISLFYGYADMETETIDAYNATAMTAALTSKCFGRIEACGFQVVKRDYNKVQLRKTLNGRPVTINIHSTSVSEDNSANSNWGGNQWAQYAQSQIAWRDFHRALRQSDVVFYTGHARHGGGLGFNIQSFGQDAFNYLTRAPMWATAKVLAERPSRLKVLGLIACSSEDYYRRAFSEANPNLHMILSRAEIQPEEGEQISIGALNALLTNQCPSGVNRALVSAEIPEAGRMIYLPGGQKARRAKAAPAPAERSQSESAQ